MKVRVLKKSNESLKASSRGYVRLFCAAVVFIFAVAAAWGEDVFYVAPDGNDKAPGSAEKPFGSVWRARNAVRALVKAGLKTDVRVVMRGGVYRLDDTLSFGTEDSGSEKHSITYAAAPGQKVLLSGGRSITGWKKGTGEVWTVELPEVKAGQWYFRQLFIGGRRAIRARTPNADASVPWWKIKTSNFTVNGVNGTYKPDMLLEEAQTSHFANRPRAKSFPSAPVRFSLNGPVKAWRNPTDVELVWLYNHTACRQRLFGVDEAAQALELQPMDENSACLAEMFGIGYTAPWPIGGKACYLENAFEMLDQPGEWYLDRKTGVLAYWPREGEDLTHADVVAPWVQESLLTVTGTRERPVRNLHFQGLFLEYVDCPLPADGHLTFWTCQQMTRVVNKPECVRSVYMPPAVRFLAAETCSYERGGIAHAGGMGLLLLDGTADIRVEGNEIHDLGAGGIAAGIWRFRFVPQALDPAPEAGEFRGYRICNNHVHHCGADYYSAAGIEASLVRQTVIAHNLVHDIAYGGIILMGNTCKDGDFARDNRVEYNHVYNVMKVATDGGGIYLQLPQAGQGATIRGNLIHDVQRNLFNPRPLGSYGMYFDQVSKNYHLKDNLVYQTGITPLVFYKARVQDNTCDGNCFITEGQPPQEFIEAMKSRAGLEREYRTGLTNRVPDWTEHVLSATDAEGQGWIASQYDCAEERKGVIQIFQRSVKENGGTVKPVGLSASATYECRVFSGCLGSGTLQYKENYLKTGEELRMSAPTLVPDLQFPPRRGKQLMEQGIVLKPAPVSTVSWIVYEGQ